MVETTIIPAVNVLSTNINPNTQFVLQPDALFPINSSVETGTSSEQQHVCMELHSSYMLVLAHTMCMYMLVAILSFRIIVA